MAWRGVAQFIDFGSCLPASSGVHQSARAVKFDQRVRAERAWIGEAIGWVREHPDATVKEVMAAVPNPDKLLVRPLAGAALAVAGRDHEAEHRRQLFVAAHPKVRIWHDAAGWHARWPVNKGTHTGITHPDDLGGLMDRLDALTATAR